MKSATVQFESVLHNSNDCSCFEAESDHVISKVFFDLEVGGKLYWDLAVEIRHSTKFDAEMPKISRPIGYDGPWDDLGFARCCIEYYLKCLNSVNPAGPAPTGPGPCAHDRLIYFPMMRRFDVSTEGGAS